MFSSGNWWQLLLAAGTGFAIGYLVRGSGKKRTTPPKTMYTDRELMEMDPEERRRHDIGPSHMLKALQYGTVSIPRDGVSRNPRRRGKSRR
jgi:hypothetical protein